MKNIFLLGGGTFSHVRTHLALAAPAFGNTIYEISDILRSEVFLRGSGARVYTRLTAMAEPGSNLVTNDDVENFLINIIGNPDTKGIFFNVALCDFIGQVGDVRSEKYAERLKTSEGQKSMMLIPAPKLIPMIRKHRKDIFVAGFKATAGATIKEQYLAGLKLLKESSINLVLANDVVTRHNIIIVPEESYYDCGTARYDALRRLVQMFVARMGLTYTRSTVVNGPTVGWGSAEIPENLRKVVNWCIGQGAYKPFLGKTAGHFAFKVDDKTFITSKRKTNFNELDEIGMVKVETQDEDSVIAYGAKPSVGGQSQRIVFSEHKDMDCIVHFHCPPTKKIGYIRPQWPYECGSHQCGKNTSDGLVEVAPGVKAVYLENHGPNIVFNRNVDADIVIDYISYTFDLKDKTGGLVS
jgi:hypothetical protein